tara:strand:+ start:1319 stop:3313 length:1995 start_codon:yes stop_codon:yes gene_type:complete
MTLLFISGCASTRLQSGPGKNSERPSISSVEQWKKEPVQASGQEAIDYQEIKFLFSKKKYTDALGLTESFITHYPKSKQLSLVYNIRGLIHLNQKESDLSIFDFKKAIEYSNNPTLIHYFRFNLAAAKYQSDQIEESLTTLKMTDSQTLDANTKFRYYFLNAKIALRKKEIQLATDYLFQASYVISDLKTNVQDQNREKLSGYLEKLVKRISNQEKLDRLYENHQNSPLADVILFQISRIALKEAKISYAMEVLQKLIESYPSSIHYSEAVDEIRRLSQTTQEDQQAIGVLLPLSGKYARFGEKALQAIELAFKIYDPQSPHSGVTLHIEDTGETIETATQALDKLYFDKHVVAIIGPLTSKYAPAVTERAQNLGIPIISLAQKNVEKGSYIFQTSVTPQIQAEEIAKYAIEHEGLKKFAILAPKDKFGEVYTHAFWDAVEELGGEVVAYETYTPNDTDFKAPMQKLAGRFYRGARYNEEEALESFREEHQIKRRTRYNQQFFKLQPIISYDAVFIPDDAKTVSLILPSFAYHDIENVRFLGINTWNSNILPKRAKRHALGSLFVSSFFEKSSSSYIQNFISRYIRSFGEKPSLVEALSFDAASLLDYTLLTIDGSISRSSIQNRLSLIQDYPGVTGRISYANGQFNRKLKVLTVENSGIVEAE